MRFCVHHGIVPTTGCPDCKADQQERRRVRQRLTSVTARGGGVSARRCSPATDTVASGAEQTARWRSTSSRAGRTTATPTTTKASARPATAHSTAAGNHEPRTKLMRASPVGDGKALSRSRSAKLSSHRTRRWPTIGAARTRRLRPPARSLPGQRRAQPTRMQPTAGSGFGKPGPQPQRAMQSPLKRHLGRCVALQHSRIILAQPQKGQVCERGFPWPRREARTPGQLCAGVRKTVPPRRHP